MQTFDSRPPRDPVIDPDLRQLQQRQSSVIKYGGLFNTLIPHASRRLLERSRLSFTTPKPRHTSTPSISSLAAAASLVTLAHTQQILRFPEDAGPSLGGILAIMRSELQVPGTPPNQERQLPQQSEVITLTPSSDDTLERNTNHHHSSNLPRPVPILMLPLPFLNTDEQGYEASNALHPGMPVVDSGRSSPSLDSDRAFPLLPRAESNASSPSLNEINTTTQPMPIPQHIRSLMHPSAQTGPIPTPMIHINRRSLAGPPNRSSSSVRTIATYVTAPTGSSPPLSVRSILRCESPGPLPDIYSRRPRVQSIQASSLRESVIADDLRHDNPWNGLQNQNPTPEELPSLTHSASSPSGSPSRKILIIGSSYKNRDEVKRAFSIESLDGVLRDRDELKTVFKERNYSVQTLIEEEFNSERALTRVAQFLNDAESGDVRAIVFTGHGHADEDGMVSLVPPECPSAGKAITCAEWDHNIRKHSRPGVVVFSIMAHCFSGEVMRQQINHQDWVRPESTNGIKKDEPIYLTFAASDSSAYESWVTRDSSLLAARTCDHFIHALVGAIRSIDASTGTWSSFFQAFEWHFQRARSCASWQDKREPPSAPHWRLSNPQIPRFSASGFVETSKNTWLHQTISADPNQHTVVQEQESKSKLRPTNWNNEASEGEDEKLTVQPSKLGKDRIEDEDDDKEEARAEAELLGELEVTSCLDGVPEKDWLVYGAFQSVTNEFYLKWKRMWA